MIFPLKYIIYNVFEVSQQDIAITQQNSKFPSSTTYF